MEVTLVRHGESMGDTLDVYQGWGDFRLTELGRRQSKVTMERLADTRVSARESVPAVDGI